MIKVEFTGDSAAAILLDMKQFVGATGATYSMPGTAQMESVADKPAKPVKEKTAPPVVDLKPPATGSPAAESTLSEEEIGKERVIIRALVEERSRISKTVLEQVRKLLYSMPQEPQAKTVSTLDPKNFAAFKEELLKIEAPKK